MTKDEIKAMTTVPQVLQQYGVLVKQGRCRSICHEGKNYTAKVSEDLYFCFKCNKTMDIFDITMLFNNCDFKSAFELLGGTEKASFTATVKAKKAKREREHRITKERRKKAELKQIQDYITAYRNILTETEPLSDLWCYCQNKLQYQLYLLELKTEKR